MKYARHQTLNGPGTLRIVLNADQIFPLEPGEGTPIMVFMKYKDDQGFIREGSATFNWASEMGYMSSGDGTQLSPEQIKFLEKHENDLYRWLDENGGCLKDA